MPNLVPTMEVYVNDVLEPRFCSDLQLYLADDLHGVAFVTVLYQIPSRRGVQRPRYTPTQNIWTKNARVRLRFGYTNSQQGVGQFYGYVQGHGIQQSTDDSIGSSFIRVQYIIVGVSLPMQNVKSRTWKGVTPSYIARTVAREYGLNPIVDPHPTVIPYYAQNQSDFSMLRELAGKYGYRFYVNGPNLYFVTPYHVLGRRANQHVPMFSKGVDPHSLDTLREFNQTEGELVNDGGVAAFRKIHTINPNTNAEVEATNRYLKQASFQQSFGPNPLVTVVHSDYTADSYNEALALLQAETTANRHWVSAFANMVGDPFIEPGSLVDLEGEGLLPVNRGYWQVRKATHYLHRDPRFPNKASYTVDTEVGRDAIGSATFNIPPEWTAAQKKPAVLVRNNRWQAETVAGS